MHASHPSSVSLESAHVLSEIRYDSSRVESSQNDVLIPSQSLTLPISHSLSLTPSLSISFPFSPLFLPPLPPALSAPTTLAISKSMIRIDPSTGCRSQCLGSTSPCITPILCNAPYCARIVCLRRPLHQYNRSLLLLSGNARELNSSRGRTGTELTCEIRRGRPRRLPALNLPKPSPKPPYPLPLRPHLWAWPFDARSLPINQNISAPLSRPTPPAREGYDTPCLR